MDILNKVVMIRVFLLFVFHMIFIQQAFAEMTIRGIVFHYQNNDPIENVNVYTSASRGTSTNNRGEFIFHVMEDDSVLIFEHIGFIKVFQKIDQNERNISVYLKPKIIILSELNVLGQNEKGVFNEFETKNMMNNIAVKDASFRTYEDIGDILMNEESVRIDESSRGEKTISIRGARQEEMVFMYDGVPINNDSRKALDLSMFYIGGLEEVEVVKGNHERALGASGTINFVPSVFNTNSFRFFQRFGTYNTGNYNSAASIGNKYLFFQAGGGKSESSQFYKNADNPDIYRESSNAFINSGLKFFSNIELKIFHLNNERNFQDYYLSDSVGSSFKINIFKIETNRGRYGDLDLYISDQIINGGEVISGKKLSRNDHKTIAGFHYRKNLNKGYIIFSGDRSYINADWKTNADNINLLREKFSFSTAIGISQKKTYKGFQIKDFVLSLNSNNVIDKNNSESNLLENLKWQDSGANFFFSAWDHLDNAIVYLYANLGSNFRIPGIYERYAYAFRPSIFNDNSLLIESKLMKEFGLKINSLVNQNAPNFNSSISYFNYSYKNKIKTIQYSASSLQFPLNDGDASISGIDIITEVFTIKKMLGFRSIYSLYNYSDQLSFSMQPLSILRNNILFKWGSFQAKITLKKEGRRVLSTINSLGELENNYLSDYQALDAHVSYVFSIGDYKANVAIFGQNLNDKSQVLEGISIFDKRVFFSLGFQWR